MVLLCSATLLVNVPDVRIQRRFWSRKIAVGGRRFRAYYAVQTGNRPYRIKIFCNNATVLS